MKQLVFIPVLFIMLSFNGENDLGMRVSFMPLVPEKESGINIEVFKCFVGQFKTWHKGAVSWNDSVYHLLDLNDPESMVVDLPYYGLRDYDSLSFDLGIDSVTSVSGVYGGDLDPINGMYWTWNSGYINFKLEGSHPSSAAKQKNITYHLGGYRAPHETVRTIYLPVHPEQEKRIEVDLISFLRQVNVEEQHKLMSMGKKASEMSDLAASIFSLSQDE